MSCTMDYVSKGYVIHFQTRGLTDVEVTNIWQKLSPVRIKEYIDETGHCLVSLGAFAVYIRKGKGNNIIVECGRKLKQDDEL